MSAKPRVLVAMSGGVDSSVTAYLLQSQGYECIGATMRLTCSHTFGDEEAQSCCSLSDLEDAEAVAGRLGIPFHVIDYRERFERCVIDKFVDTYEMGRTPNPCIDCNRHMKFGALLDHALELGCEYVSTGHYARIRRQEASLDAPARWELVRGLDAAKDQSYVLYSLTQQRLAHVLLPLGGLVKERDVRRIAREQGLLNAQKPDSQGICFVPDDDFAGYLERRRGRALPNGDILDTEGRVLGHHRGAVRYTIGQRKGLGVAAAHPLYVCGIDARANTVTLGDATHLMATQLVADDWIWSTPDTWIEQRVRAAGEAGLACAAKIRYHQPDQTARLHFVDDATGCAGGVKLTFETPQRAIAPGQAVVVYEGDVVLGGGCMREVIR